MAIKTAPVKASTVQPGEPEDRAIFLELIEPNFSVRVHCSADAPDGLRDIAKSVGESVGVYVRSKAGK